MLSSLRERAEEAAGRRVPVCGSAHRESDLKQEREDELEEEYSPSVSMWEGISNMSHFNTPLIQVPFPEITLFRPSLCSRPTFHLIISLFGFDVVLYFVFGHNNIYI